MLREHEIREFEEYEQEGVDVVAVSSRGTLEYSTQDLGGNEFCDQCSSFRLLPDPDPHDWFRDVDKKAVCLEVNGLIEGSLEKPSEWINVRKPLYCPKLGRELNEDEKAIAKKRLVWAKEFMK